MKLNNERLPGKNTKSFTNGKPLCQYILNTLLKVEGIDQIYVYCSDPSIMLYLPKGIKFLKRDPALDGSHVKINEVLKAFAKIFHLMFMYLPMQQPHLSTKKRWNMV